MKMKRMMAFMLTAVLTAGSLTGLTGCGKKQKISEDGSTLNIRVWRMGFGDAYVTALAEAFEKAYEKEGYKVNIVSSDSNTFGSAVTNELLLEENNGIDMYFTNAITPNLLVSTSKNSNVDMIAADLSDVYDSAAIGSDRKEEAVTIKEKLREEHVAAYTYFGQEEEYYGKQYCFPLRTSPAGLIVNEELLSTYDLDVPNTTDELIHCYEVISEESKATGVYPNAWAGYNAVSYLRYLLDVWVAQYSGVDNYRKFMNMEYSDDPAEGWKVYEDQGWVESLDVLGVIMNPDYAPAKTLSMDHTTAQHEFLSGGAVFMSNGAWLENEMNENYSDETWNITMIQTPVISALGTRLGLDGKGGADAAKCDAVLSQVVGLIDEDKATNEIIAAVSSQNGVALNEEQVEAVRDARKIYFDKSADEEIVVNPYSKNLDIVKLFLRFIASDAGCQIILDYSKTYPAFESLSGLKDADVSNFQKSVNSIASIEGARTVDRLPGGMRSDMNIAFFNAHSTVEKELAGAKGKLSGADIMKDEIEYIQKVWPERLATYQKK